MDDIFGANFVDGSTSGDPYDDNGHGTFVAGVVGAVGNNKVGISGVSQVASVIGECGATPEFHIRPSALERLSERRPTRAHQTMNTAKTMNTAIWP